VRALVENDVGETIVLGESAAGDIFGEVSLFDGGPRTASVVAVEPTEVLTLSRDAFLRFLTQNPGAALDVMAVITQRFRNLDGLLRGCVTRNANIEEEKRLSFAEHMADRVAAFGGSWTFILVFCCAMGGWVILNAVFLVKRPFDPYPFILLNLALSTLAAFQAPVIMMAQNRQSMVDRLKAELEYQINLKAELEIAQLHRKVDRLYETVQAHFARSAPAPAPVDGPPGERLEP
jgi:uncharacterized membrane protein